MTGSSLNSGRGIGELVGSTGLADAPSANSSSSNELGNVESASLTIAERRCTELLIGTNLIVVRVFDDEKSMPISDKVLSSFSLIRVYKSQSEIICQILYDRELLLKNVCYQLPLLLRPMIAVTCRSFQLAFDF